MGITPTCPGWCISVGGGYSPLSSPHFDRLYEGNVRGEDTSNVVDIPPQHRVTQEIIGRWKPFKDLKQTFVMSRRSEHLRLHSQYRIVTTVEDSALRTEMGTAENKIVSYVGPVEQGLETIHKHLEIGSLYEMGSLHDHARRTR